MAMGSKLPYQKAHIRKEKLLAVGSWPYLPLTASRLMVWHGMVSKNSYSSTKAKSGVKGPGAERLKKASPRG